eukprot:6473968-Amphidinium_carterae.1
MHQPRPYCYSVQSERHARLIIVELRSLPFTMNHFQRCSFAIPGRRMETCTIEQCKTKVHKNTVTVFVSDSMKSRVCFVVRKPSITTKEWRMWSAHLSVGSGCLRLAATLTSAPRPAVEPLVCATFTDRT